MITIKCIVQTTRACQYSKKRHVCHMQNFIEIFSQSVGHSCNSLFNSAQ